VTLSRRPNFMHLHAFSIDREQSKKNRDVTDAWNVRKKVICRKKVYGNAGPPLIYLGTVTVASNFKKEKQPAGSRLIERFHEILTIDTPQHGWPVTPTFGFIRLQRRDLTMFGGLHFASRTALGAEVCAVVVAE